MNIKDYFNKKLNFIKDNKIYFINAISVCIIFIFLFLITKVPEDIKSMIMKQASEYIKNIISSNQFILAWNIFINNTTISFLILISGFLLSVLGIIIMFSNIFLIGIVLEIGIEKMGALKSILAILPHGIFEISAIILTLGLSFKITTLTIKKIWNWRKTIYLKELKKIFFFWLSFIVPLLLFAAIVETFITPLFLK